jgi:hypothetical protein
MADDKKLENDLTLNAQKEKKEKKKRKEMLTPKKKHCLNGCCVTNSVFQMKLK